MLFASTPSSGERLAVEEAIKRIKEKLSNLKKSEKEEEYRFSVPDRWSRQVFIALCVLVKTRDDKINSSYFNTLI